MGISTLAATTPTGKIAPERWPDQRTEARDQARGNAMLMVRSCREPALNTCTTRATILEHSVSGLRLNVPRLLLDGTVELWVQLDDAPGYYFLYGEIRWSSIDTGEAHIGIEIMPGRCTDYASWQELHAD